MARYLPTARIIDNNGKPIVGAKTYFYETGTTTLKTIYSDSGLTVTQANPVLSLAGGVLPEIFISSIYKVIQKDENDVQIGVTRDPAGETSGSPMDLWINTKIYVIPDIVKGSDDSYYRSLLDSNQGNDPISSPTNWEELSFGRIWNTNVTYAFGDSVYGSDGNLYSALIAQSGNNPISNTTNWKLSGAAMKSGTAIVTTSGTEAAFTSIPAWAKKITVMLQQVSADGIAPLFLQIGESAGSYATSGYDQVVVELKPGVAVGGDSSGVGFELIASPTTSGSDTMSGSAVLSFLDKTNNTWVCSSSVKELSNLSLSVCGGFVNLPGTLDRVRLWSGDTFDNGKMNIIYEG